MIHAGRRRSREIALEVRERPERLAVYALALLGAAVTVKESYGSFGPWALVVMFVLLLGVLILALRHRPDASGAMPTTADIEVPYRIQIPPGIDVVKRVIARCQTYFQGAAIDPGEDLRAFTADPYSIVVLTDPEGREIGFIDFYFFDRDEFDRYLSGELTFEAVLQSGLLRDPEARSAQVVYVGTHVHFDFYDNSRRWRGRENGLLVWGAIQLLLLTHRFPPDGLDLYAMAWSRQGSDVLEHMMFEPGGPELVVKHGPAAGKPIYCRRNVTAKKLRRSAQTYDRFARRVCELVLNGERVSRRRAAAAAPVVAATGSS